MMQTAAVKYIHLNMHRQRDTVHPQRSVYTLTCNILRYRTRF